MINQINNPEELNNFPPMSPDAENFLAAKRAEAEKREGGKTPEIKFNDIGAPAAMQETMHNMSEISKHPQDNSPELDLSAKHELLNAIIKDPGEIVQKAIVHPPQEGSDAEDILNQLFKNNLKN